MTKADILDLFHYNSWANERIAAILLELSPEQLTRDFGGSYPTIRDAFSHIAGAEWIWLERWSGNNPTAPPGWVASNDPLVVVSALREVEKRREIFLSQLGEDDLGRGCAFRLLSGTSGEQTLRDLFVQVVNHSTFHRGQVVSMLRQAGRPAPPTDFLVYRNITKARA